MSRNIFVDLPNELIWPEKCAMCGTSNPKRLDAFNTSEERKSILPIPIPFLGALYVSRTIEVNINYPVCENCWSESKKSTFLSQGLPFICLIALVVTFAAMAQSAAGYWPKWIYSASWILVVIEFFVFVICAIATTKVPVRINNLRKNSVELVFSNDRYSKEFEILNQPYARYISKTKSLIGLKG